MSRYIKVEYHMIYIALWWVVVVLLDPFRGMGVQRNSAETQQSGHAPTSGSKMKVVPISRHLIVVVQPPPLYREVGRNGKTNSPRDPTIGRLPIVYIALIPFAMSHNLPGSLRP